MTEEYFKDGAYIDWSTWARMQDARKNVAARQLRIEVGPSHKLFHLLGKLDFLAQDDATDSILVRDPADGDTAFVVHPTFSSTKSANNKFPLTYSISLKSIPKRLL